jgi:hypothetical protein
MLSLPEYLSAQMETSPEYLSAQVHKLQTSPTNPKLYTACRSHGLDGLGQVQIVQTLTRHSGRYPEKLSTRVWVIPLALLVTK